MSYRLLEILQGYKERHLDGIEAEEFQSLIDSIGSHLRSSKHPVRLEEGIYEVMDRLDQAYRGEINY